MCLVGWDWGGLVDGGSVSVSSLGLWGIDCSALISDLSNESVVVISSVGGGLDPSVGEGDGERSSDLALSILGLRLLEVSLRVVIGYTVLIGVWLGGKLLLFVGRGRVVGRGSTVGWGAIGGNSGQESSGDKKLK